MSTWINVCVNALIYSFLSVTANDLFSIATEAYGDTAHFCIWKKDVLEREGDSPQSDVLATLGIQSTFYASMFLPYGVLCQWALMVTPHGL